MNLSLNSPSQNGYWHLVLQVHFGFCQVFLVMLSQKFILGPSKNISVPANIPLAIINIGSGTGVS